jgi:hypothetical protein
VLDKELLQKVFGPEMEEVTGYLRKFRNEELHDLYFSLNIIRVMRSRRTGLVGHITPTTMTRNAYRFSLDNLKEVDRLGDLQVYGKIILKCVLKLR